MKIKMMLAPDDPLRIELEKLGVVDDPEAKYSLLKEDYEVGYVQGRIGEQQFFVDVKEIVFIESLGHNILIHTQNETYNSRENLKYFETVLDPQKFLRISNSCIICRKKIRRIESSLLQKFILHMSEGTKVEVTRSYYYRFKEVFRI